jgi:hypothetical protein
MLSFLPSLPARNRLQLLNLLVLFIMSIFQVYAQQEKPVSAGADRINACFSASKTELAEGLCLFYNHSFSYYRSYGAVDQSAKGVYRISNDTIYLHSSRPRSFAIRCTVNPAVAKGKIKLVFKNPGRNASYISWRTGGSDYQYAEDAAKAGNNYVAVVEKPIDGLVQLQHTLYDFMPQDYTLEPGKNEYSIGLSDSLGIVAFDDKPLVWDGNDLRSPDETDRQTFRLSAATPSFVEVDWNTSESRPTEAVFNEWSLQQQERFRRNAQLKEEREAASALQALEWMQQHISTRWEDALSRAAADSTGIILLLGDDSVVVDQSIPGDAADTASPAPILKKSMVADYYAAFLPEYGRGKLPVFYKSATGPYAVKKRFAIDVLPAVVVLGSNGSLLFKNEGMYTGAAELRDIYFEAQQATEKKALAAFITSFISPQNDSAALVRMIDYSLTATPAVNEAFEAAGISTRSLVDSLVLRWLQPAAYSKAAYDYVSTRYFKEEWYKYFVFTDSTNPATPSLHYLVNNFASRQQEQSSLPQPAADSLATKIYINLTGLLNIETYKAADDPARYSVLLAMGKKLINGNKRYSDFFSSIFYLSHRLRAVKKKQSPALVYQQELEDFLSTYAGERYTVVSSIDSAAKALYAEMRRDNNTSLLDAYMGNSTGEDKFVQAFRSANGHIITLLVIARLIQYPDTCVNAAGIQKAAAMPLLEAAGAMNALGSDYSLQRNYAYALYTAGNAKRAIPLLQEVLSNMTQSRNKYIVTPAMTQLVKDNIARMKAGKPICFNINTMSDY